MADIYINPLIQGQGISTAGLEALQKAVPKIVA